MISKISYKYIAEENHKCAAHKHQLLNKVLFMILIQVCLLCVHVHTFSAARDVLYMYFNYI